MFLFLFHRMLYFYHLNGVLPNFEYHPKLKFLFPTIRNHRKIWWWETNQTKRQTRRFNFRVGKFLVFLDDHKLFSRYVFILYSYIRIQWRTKNNSGWMLCFISLTLDQRVLSINLKILVWIKLCIEQALLTWMKLHF